MRPILNAWRKLQICEEIYKVWIKLYNKMIDLYRYYRLSVLGLCLRINDWFVCLDYSDCFASDLFLCPARYDRRDIMFPGCPSVRPSVRPALGVPLYVQRPAKAMPFQPIIMHAVQCQNDLDVHLLFCVDLDLHITSSRGRV